MEQYLRETQMLNFSAVNIQKLISDRGWRHNNAYTRIK